MVSSVRILVIERELGERERIGALIGTQALEKISFELSYAASLQEAYALATRRFNLILVGLDLLGEDLELLYRLRVRGGRAQVVVVGSLEQERKGLRAMLAGAIDFIPREDLNGLLLLRVILYSIEHHRVLEHFRTLSFTDELTGLYNRRGFLQHAMELLEELGDQDRGLAIFFIDLDSMKQINDSFGHQCGDEALIHAAQCIRESFRAYDLVARLGGDEFVVIAEGVSEEEAEGLRTRFEKHIEEYSRALELPYNFSLSVGMCLCREAKKTDIYQLLAEADSDLYTSKHRLIRKNL